MTIIVYRLYDSTHNSNGELHFGSDQGDTYHLQADTYYILGDTYKPILTTY